MCGVRVKNREEEEEEEKGLITKHCFNYIKKMPYKLLKYFLCVDMKMLIILDQM